MLFIVLLTFFLCNGVSVFSPDIDLRLNVESILNSCSVDYKVVNELDIKSNELYIITDLYIDNLPENYIYYIGQHGLDLSLHTDKLDKSIAIWDSSWNSINLYKSNISHYYFVSGDCDYKDVICMPCFLDTEYLRLYKKVLSYSNYKNSDISSLLPILFYYCAVLKPKTIVELGVRGGESTYVFSKICGLINSKLTGVDIVPSCKSSYMKVGKFICGDDLEISKNFEKESIDFLFIDTSHEYEHTIKEINKYLPLISKKGVICFHDSNIAPVNNLNYYRLNGTVGYSKNPPTGVFPAIKNYFSIDFDNSKNINSSFYYGGLKYNIIHYPFCNGLTLVMKG